MSQQQTLAYSPETASHNFDLIKRELSKPGTYYVVFFGSVVYFTEVGSSGLKAGSITLPTTTKVNAFLDCRFTEAVSASKSHFYIINGANDSSGQHGTTYTTSLWVNNYNINPFRRDIVVKCFGLAPYETCDMKAIWMEEYGHSNTKTYIVGKTAKERRERLVELATTADQTVISEGGPGTLDEITMLYAASPEIFEEKVFMTNISYLVDNVIPSELAKLTPLDVETKEVYTYFQTQFPTISI
jgi:hypothetical protein|tara:strand:- start:245 stop:973 length:729 start_codon:yes stop_codon:yes gene_type:complete